MTVTFKCLVSAGPKAHFQVMSYLKVNFTCSVNDTNEAQAIRKLHKNHSKKKISSKFEFSNTNNNTTITVNHQIIIKFIINKAECSG